MKQQPILNDSTVADQRIRAFTIADEDAQPGSTLEYQAKTMKPMKAQTTPTNTKQIRSNELSNAQSLLMRPSSADQYIKKNNDTTSKNK